MHGEAASEFTLEHNAAETVTFLRGTNDFLTSSGEVSLELALRAFNNHYFAVNKVNDAGKEEENQRKMLFSNTQTSKYIYFLKQHKLYHEDCESWAMKRFTLLLIPLHCCGNNKQSEQLQHNRSFGSFTSGRPTPAPTRCCCVGLYEEVTHLFPFTSDGFM